MSKGTGLIKARCGTSSTRLVIARYFVYLNHNHGVHNHAYLSYTYLSTNGSSRSHGPRELIGFLFVGEDPLVASSPLAGRSPAG